MGFAEVDVGETTRVPWDALLWRPLLAETDVLVAVPHPRAARVTETHLLMLHCLCDAVDLQLMGELETA